ncbi:MAG: hypothetical protein R6U61_04915 [Thermoplasmata archaeon]
MSENAIIQGLIKRIAPQLDMAGLLVAWKYLDREQVDADFIVDIIDEREAEMERELRG